MIFRLTGGLANQAFIYASARGITMERHLPLQFFWARSTWDYALGAYNVRVELVNQPKHLPIYDEPEFSFDQGLYTTPREVYVRGYLQSERYFEKYKDVIRRELTLKEPVRQEVELLADMLRNQNSVFLHVRRADYLSPGTADFHGNLGHANLQEGYYKDATNYILEKVNDPKIIVFSDDPTWCKQNLPYPVIAGFNQHEDLYLMQNCKHGIGANSTFSWFANWLGERPDRICIAPKQWFNNNIDTSDVIPERWTRL